MLLNVRLIKIVIWHHAQLVFNDGAQLSDPADGDFFPIKTAAWVSETNNIPIFLSFFSKKALFSTLE
jgi:hypothetical protein